MKREREREKPPAGALEALPLDLVPDAIVAVTAAGVIVSVNAQAEALFGYEPGGLVGRRVDELVSEAQRAAHAAHRRRFFEHPRSRPMGTGVQLYGLRRDGQTFPVDISLSTLQSEDGPLALAAVRDVSARAETRRELERTAAELEDAQRIAHIGSWRWDPCAHQREWSAGMFAVYGRDPVAGPLDTAQSFSLVHPDDLERVRDAYARMLEGGEGFELDYRLLAGDRGWRTVHAIARPDRSRPGCYHGTLQDVTEVRATELALRERTDALDLLLDGAPIGMAVINLDGRFTRVNQALCQMLGYSQEQLLGMTFLDIVHPDELAESVAMHNRVRAGELARGQLQKRYVRSDGETIFANLSLATVRDADGKPRFLIRQLEDITAQRAAADARARLAAVVESSYDAIITATLDGTITSWNAAAERIYGYSGGEAVGQHVSLLAAGPAEQVELDRRFAQFARGEILEPTETRRRRKDGTVIELSTSASPILGLDGAIIGVAAISRDISDEKRAHAALQLSQRRLEQAELTAHMGSWEWDLQTHQVQWSAGLYALLDFDPDTTSTDVEHGLASRVHPDDRDRVRSTLDQAVEQLRPIESEHRVFRRDGRVRTIDLHAEPIVDQTGKPIRVVGVIRDVTDEKQTQDALTTASAGLAAYAQELQRLAVQHAGSDTPTLPALTDRQLEILRLIAQGLSTAKIAKQLYLSEPTIKWHVKQILAKTGAANRTEAVARVLGATASPPPHNDALTGQGRAPTNEPHARSANGE